MLKMTIGPSRMAASVLTKMAVAPPALTDPDFLNLTGNCLRNLREVLGASTGVSFIVPGTGTMGMEAVVASLIQRGETVAIVSTGFWGDRWTTICRRLGIETQTITCAPGTPPDPSEVERLLAATKVSTLLLTHVDSSSGVLLDVETLSRIAQEYGVMTFVDGMCAAGIEEVEQEKWGVDVYLTSTPKGLGVPAGLILVSGSERMKAALVQRTWDCPSFSLDLKPWVAVMEAAENNLPGYFQSPAGNLILGLDEGLRLVLQEGRDARVARHARLTARLHAGLAELGISLMATSPAARAHGVSVCFYPEGITSEFLKRVADAGVVLVSGLYQGLADRTFRIGHLGNVTKDDVDETLRAIATVLSAEAKHLQARTA